MEAKTKKERADDKAAREKVNGSGPERKMKVFEGHGQEKLKGELKGEKGNRPKT